jgi:hypothetical protein
MAKIRDLLMGIAFFGKGYINAKRRNDQAAAAKMYQALQMQQLELQLEKAKAAKKQREREEKQLAKKREQAAKAERAAIASVGGANPINVLAGLMQETPVSRVTGEPKTSEAQLPKIDLQLQGAMPLDTRTTTQAIDRLKSGEGRQLTPSRRLTPSRNELIQRQQTGRGIEQRLPGGSYERATGTQGLDRGAISMPDVDVVSTPLAPETEPLLTPDQEKIKKRNEASWGFGVPGNINQTAVPIPAKNIGSKVPEVAVNKTAQIFNSTLSEAEKKAADILQVLIPMRNPDLKDIVIPGSFKDLAIQADAHSKNTETKFVEGPDGRMTFVRVDKRDGSMITSTEVIKGKDKRPLTYADWKAFTEDDPGLKGKYRHRRFGEKRNSFTA